MNATDWILAQVDLPMTVETVGRFETAEGQISVIDPLCATEAEFVPVPSSGARLDVFIDAETHRESKFALVFNDADVIGGRHILDCVVDGGVASPVTPSALAALNNLRAQLPAKYPPDSPYHRYPAPNLYIEHFEKYDEAGAEPFKATLPDGTAMPYIHSGWGDGEYPVFSLTDQTGALCAIYCDFMGRDEDENWLTPPGVSID